MDEAKAVVRRLFLLAARRQGGAAALAEYLGLEAVELAAYLRGEAMPPEELLLRAVSIVLEDLKAHDAAVSEQTWRALFAHWRSTSRS